MFTTYRLQSQPMASSSLSTPASTELAGSGNEASSQVKTIKGRRSHTKSRKGCTECKNRHIRCDERQPSCANCEIAERTCVYPPPKSSKQKERAEHGTGNKRKRNSKPAATAKPVASSVLGGHDNADSIDNLDAVLGQAHISSLPLRSESQATNSLRPDDSSNPLPPRHDASPLVTVAGAELTQNPAPDAEDPPTDVLLGLLSDSDAVYDAIFTTQHMILLRYADTVPNYRGENRSIVDIALRYAVGSPYLLDEVLAFTAFHLMYLDPGSSSLLAQLATELQTRALTSFTRLTENVPIDDKATAVPRFLFSSILGRHYLAETLAHHRSDVHVFISRVAECFSLNRGIRAVTPPARDFLYDTELRPFLASVLDAQSKVSTPENDTDPLRSLFDDSELDEASIEMGRRTIQLLQHSFDIARHLDEEEYPQAAITFSVHVEAGFVDLLRKHQPEALIILAFYGVLLRRCRTFWAFHDGGAYIVDAISKYLSGDWRSFLIWALAKVP